MEALAFGLWVLAKGSLILLAAWLLILHPSWSAARRHAVMLGGILAYATVPVLVWVLPAVPVPLPDRAIIGGAWGEGNTVGVTGRPEEARSADPLPHVSAQPAVQPPRSTPPVTTSAGTPRRSPAAPGSAWLLGLWATGSMMLLLRLTVTWKQAGAWAEAGSPVREPGWRQDLERARERLGFDAPVRLVAHAGRRVPVALACPRPTIVVPAAAARWPSRRRQAALLHELAHLQRRDPWTRCGALVVCALFWPNPILWLARRTADGLAERACDDAVLRAGVSPSEYVLQLVEVARQATRDGSAPVPALVTRRGLEGRARAVLAPRSSRAPGGARAVIVAAIAGLSVAAGVSPLRPGSEGPRGAAAATLVGERAQASCPYAGGTLRNRYLPEDEGARVWEAYWEGERCSARLRIRSTAAGSVESWLARGGRHGVQLAPRTPETSLTLRFATPGRVVETDVGSDGFLLRVDRLTGVIAPIRVPLLLEAGGVDAVLREAEQTRGDHAGGVYLNLLLEARRLDQGELGELLRIAARRVRNEAVLVALLRKVADDYVLDDAQVDAAFRSASTNLRTRAGREAVLGEGEGRS